MVIAFFLADTPMPYPFTSGKSLVIMSISPEVNAEGDITTLIFDWEYDLYVLETVLFSLDAVCHFLNLI